MSATGDKRFEALVTDPRFARFSRKQHRVKIDERFRAVFEDDDFGVTSKHISKRGAKQSAKRRRGNDEMRQYYELEDDDGGVHAGSRGGKEQDEAVESQGATERVQAQRDASPSARRTNGKHVKSLEPSGRARAGAKNAAVEVGLAQRAGAVSAKPAAGSGPGAAEHRGRAEDKAGGPGVAPMVCASDKDDKTPARRRFAAIRGLGAVAESSSEAADSDTSSDAPDAGREAITIGEDDEVELDLAEWGVGAAAGRPDADATLTVAPDVTARVAVVDLDWSRIRAVDILAVLGSFVGARGALRRVAVYMSDYGRAEMAFEKEHGPRALAGGNGGVDGGADEEATDARAVAEARERVRMYERSRLRWYYAVATFDSAATAARVYNECDGHEFEESAVTFDLRFVPDGETFDGREVRDEAAEVPAGYAPPIFKSQALQHTAPRLTWDDEDPDRKRALAARRTLEELEEEDLRAYLASSSSSEDEGGGGRASPRAGAADIRARFGDMMSADKDPVHQGGRSWRSRGTVSGGPSEDEELAMEVTFASGLEGLGKRLLDKRADPDARAAETLFESHMRRRRERKAAQRALGRTRVDSGTDSDGGGSEGGGAAAAAGAFFADGDGAPDAGFDDAFFENGGAANGVGDELEGGSELERGARKRHAGRKGRQVPDAAARQQDAELELLLMDEQQLQNGDGGGGHLAGDGGHAGKDGKLSRKKRLAAKKEDKRKARDRGDSDDDRFEADMGDPRFAGMATADFALDPTDPHFTRLKKPKAILDAVARSRSGGSGQLKPGEGSHAMKGAAADGRGLGGGLQSLVRKIKKRQRGPR